MRKIGTVAVAVVLGAHANSSGCGSRAGQHLWWGYGPAEEAAARANGALEKNSFDLVIGSDIVYLREYVHQTRLVFLHLEVFLQKKRMNERMKEKKRRSKCIGINQTLPLGLKEEQVLRSPSAVLIPAAHVMWAGPHPSRRTACPHWPE
jgi:hypothetical protein